MGTKHRIYDSDDSSRPTSWWILGLTGDPTPGDTSTVVQQRETLYNLADDVDRTYPGVVTLLTDPAIVGWLGASGDAFRDACAPFPDQLHTLSAGCRDAGAAYDAWLSKLENLQADADGHWGEVSVALSDLGYDDLGGLTSLAGIEDDTAYMNQLAKLVPALGPPKSAPHQGVVPAPDDGDVHRTRILNARQGIRQTASDFTAAARQCRKALEDAAAVLGPISAKHMIGRTDAIGFQDRFLALGGNLGDLVLPEVGAADMEGVGYDQSRVDAAAAALRAADALNDPFKIQALNQQLLGLTPAELEAFMEQVPDDQLKAYFALLSGQEILTVFQPVHPTREEVLDGLLAKMPAGQLERFDQDFPRFAPSWLKTDMYVNGGDTPQRTAIINGTHWGEPNEPIFSKPPTPDDVAQGAFADCWYLAPLIGITMKNPQFIQDGIRENPNGTVSVRIWDKDGNLRWVTMTREIPVDTNGNAVAANGPNGDLWPAYYEKAFALVYADGKGDAFGADGKERSFDHNEQGDYGAIEWNNPANAAQYLTGHGGTDLGNNLADIQKSFDSGHPVTVSAYPKDHKIDMSAMPQAVKDAYVPNHVFYVLGFTPDHQVILGNPWGPGYPNLTVDDAAYRTLFESASAVNMS